MKNASKLVAKPNISGFTIRCVIGQGFESRVLIQPMKSNPEFLLQLKIPGFGGLLVCWVYNHSFWCHVSLF